MDRHSIVLRAANPSLDDGLALSRHTGQTAEGFFRFMLGRRVESIMATAFAQPEHDLSYQNVTFAERDDVIVGMLAAYTAVQYRGPCLPLRIAPPRRL